MSQAFSEWDFLDFLSFYTSTVTPFSVHKHNVGGGECQSEGREWGGGRGESGVWGEERESGRQSGEAEREMDRWKKRGKREGGGVMEKELGRIPQLYPNFVRMAVTSLVSL